MTLNEPSFVLLDSFVYTYVTSQDDLHYHPHHRPPGFPTPQADPASARNRTSIIAPAIGGAVGGTVCVIALAALIFCYYREKKEQAPGRSLHPIDMLACEARRPPSFGTDASSSATALTPGYASVATRQLPARHSIPLNSPSSYPVHTSRWAGYRAEPHTRPLRPSSLSSLGPPPLPPPGPLPQLPSTRAENPPPVYAQFRK